MDPPANMNSCIGTPGNRGSFQENSTALMTPPPTPSNNNQVPPQPRRQGPGPRLIVDFSDLTVPVPSCPRSLQPDELRRLFLVSLEKMFTLEPESIPFRQPVDPQALGIPDYIDIIRKPMDLQTIRLKMNTLKYTDPWMYVDDVLLMFDNAWVYNRPSSMIFKYCCKLAEIFQQEINPVMTRLGYRHGRIHQFNSQTLSCFGRPVCLVGRNAKYYNFLRFHLCEKCYSQNLDEDGVKLPWQNNVRVDSSNFIQLINDAEAYSPAVEMHRSYLRDAEMSRHLVIREFLSMLSSPTNCSTSSSSSEKKKNILKMLKLNSQLRSEFLHYFHQQKEQFLLTPTEVCRVREQLKNIKEKDELEETGVVNLSLNLSPMSITEEDSNANNSNDSLDIPNSSFNDGDSISPSSSNCSTLSSLN